MPPELALNGPPVLKGPEAPEDAMVNERAYDRVRQKRPPRLPVGDEAIRRSLSAVDAMAKRGGRPPGVPTPVNVVPCRYFKEGKCSKGSALRGNQPLGRPASKFAKMSLRCAGARALHAARKRKCSSTFGYRAGAACTFKHVVVDASGNEIGEVPKPPAPVVAKPKKPTIKLLKKPASPAGGGAPPPAPP